MAKTNTMIFDICFDNHLASPSTRNVLVLSEFPPSPAPPIQCRHYHDHCPCSSWSSWSSWSWSSWSWSSWSWSSSIIMIIITLQVHQQETCWCLQKLAPKALHCPSPLCAEISPGHHHNHHHHHHHRWCIIIIIIINANGFVILGNCLLQSNFKSIKYSCMKLFLTSSHFQSSVRQSADGSV